MDALARVHSPPPPPPYPLAGNEKALATVTAIIDGMGSCGAALGPMVTGYISEAPGGFDNVFIMLCGSAMCGGEARPAGGCAVVSARSAQRASCGRPWAFRASGAVLLWEHASPPNTHTHTHTHHQHQHHTHARTHTYRPASDTAGVP
jgi:hypothetical protein